MSENYIGFADSDKFLEAIDRTKPVNLSMTRRSGHGDRRFGISIDQLVLTVSQAQPDEILYFECTPFRWQSVAGRPMLQDEDKPARLASESLRAAEKYLTDHGVIWREALLAMPSNYTTMHGEATFLHWNKEAESYEQADAELTAGS